MWMTLSHSELKTSPMMDKDQVSLYMLQLILNNPCFSAHRITEPYTIFLFFGAVQTLSSTIILLAFHLKSLEVELIYHLIARELPFWSFQ